jgi:hypothetical protein
VKIIRIDWDGRFAIPAKHHVAVILGSKDRPDFPMFGLVLALEKYVWSAIAYTRPKVGVKVQRQPIMPSSV